MTDITADSAPERATQYAQAVPGERLSYVPEVDALRAFAVSAVIIFHCELLHFAWMGVWLFFVISGFAITTSLINSDAERPSRGLLIRNFYVRRSLRIWPLYFGYVAVATVFIVAAGLRTPLSDLPWLVTFTENFRQIFRVQGDGTYWVGFGILWTLAVEEQFYLVFPALFAFLSRAALMKALGVMIFLAPLVRYLTGLWAQAQGWTDDSTGRAVYAFSLAQMDSFALGCVLALVRPRFEGNLRLARLLFAAALAAAALYAAAYVGVDSTNAGSFSPAVMRELFPHHNWGEGREVFLYSVVIAVSASLIGLILAGEKALLWLCRLPLLQYFGRISYGAYIFHGIVIWFYSSYVGFFGGGGQDMDKTQRILLLLVSYPTIFLLAHISFQLYEKRFLALRHKFG